jgi:hypothetical protein
VSTAKSLFIRRESGVWASLWSQKATLIEANACLAQWSTEVADLRLLYDELKRRWHGRRCNSDSWCLAM